MKNFIIKTSFLFSTTTLFYAAENKSVITIQTTIKIKEFIDSLAVEELLTILSIGTVKKFADTPQIAHTLYTLQTELNEAFETALAKHNLSPEAYEDAKLALQQKTMLMLYTLIYKKAKNIIDTHSNVQQQAVLDFQLTPDELKNYLKI
jgi:hypothetical protein